MLGSAPWTDALVELDRVRGCEPVTFEANDPKAQLRLVTERLGQLGYPFEPDDGHGSVTNSGLALRVTVCRLAQGSQFTAPEAWRAYDLVRQLLDALGDSEGAVAASTGQAALVELASEQEGLTLDEIRGPELVNLPAKPRSKRKEPDQPVVPASEVWDLPFDSLKRLIGRRRPAFEPWVAVPVGQPDQLSRTDQPAVRDQIRALALEIAKFEGPIHVHRLATLIAHSFGVPRLFPKRSVDITDQILLTQGLEVDVDDFIWPFAVDRVGWRQFRPNDSTVDRPAWAISPVEIANAAEFWLERSVGGSDLEGTILRTFGQHRASRDNRRHIRLSIQDLALAHA